MTRILVVPWGRGLGHAVRCLEMARQAVAAGHHVTVVAGDEAAQHVERSGSERVALPRELRELGPWHGWTDPDHVRTSVDADLALLEVTQPDVVLNDIRWSMIIAAEVAGVRCLPLVHDTMHPRYAVPPENDFWRGTARALGAVMTEHGLSALGNDTRELFFRDLAVAPSVPQFDVVLASDDRTRFVGPLVAPPPGTPTPLPPMVSDLRVYVYGFAPGTEGLGRLVTALDGIDCQLLVAGAPPAAERRGPAGRSRPSVSVLPVVDPARVMQACTVSVIHGGHGSCLASMSAGLPSVVVVPDRGDGERSYNGRRVESLGAGTLLSGPDAWDDLAGALRYTATDEEVRASAQRQRDTMVKWRASTALVQVLTSVAASR